LSITLQWMAFRLAPLVGVARLAEAGRWRVESLPARMVIAADCGDFPSGWMLLQANLLATGYDRTARLYADTGGEEAAMPVFDLPLSAKGILIELIKLPPGTRRLVLQPMNSLGEFHLVGLRVRPVGFVERFARMLFRVAVTRYLQPRRRLHRLGLRWFMPLFDLPRAYRLAGCLRAQAPAPTYADWVARQDALTARDQRRINRDVARLLSLVRFDVWLLAGTQADDAAWQVTSASLSAQALPPTGVQRLTPESGDFASLQSVEVGSRHWLLILPEGATLSPQALYWFAHEIVAHPDAGWIYCDHDGLSPSGERIDPVFKPDWSPELLRSTNYIGPAAAVRADIWTAAGGIGETASLHDVWLRVSEHVQGEQIRHVCAPLIHLPANPQRRFMASDPQAVARHLARLGVAAAVEPDRWGHCRVRYSLPTPGPLVSIIVPTRDGLDFLRPCVDSVLEKTTYREFELLVVDNQSSDPTTLAYLADISRRERVRVLRYDAAFNFSAINNFAMRAARGEFVCLLNNDTAVISPDWLDEMLGRLLQPQVGAVGAKLYFADGRVQHAGDVVGPGGCANHLHALLPGDAPGYQHRAVLAQDLSAVTAACLLTRRDLYLSLGGLNERDLSVAFNDVDYCLRLWEAGWRVVWSPYAELFHYESVSRGKDVSPERKARADQEVAYMVARWAHVMRHDPFYNPNLSYARPDFSLSHAPLVARPWE
jgi:O-antigen biosynthesis protein